MECYKHFKNGSDSRKIKNDSFNALEKTRFLFYLLMQNTGWNIVRYTPGRAEKKLFCMLYTAYTSFG